MDKRVCDEAVQGFGKVGADAARFLSEAGLKIVAVSDINGAIYCQSGIDIADLKEYVRRNQSIVGYPKAKAIPPEDLLTLEIDVLVPAAVENVLNAENAESVQAKLIVEGANGPTTIEADKIFERRGITVVPDILANSGGVLVSYFEWIQSNESHWWTIAEIERLQSERMITAWNEVQEFACRNEVSYRKAATALAVKRVADAHDIRGLYP